MADQLRIGDQAQPTGEPTFATDDMLAKLVLDVENVLRGATAKLSGVRHSLDPRAPADPDPHRMRRALEHLADPASWLGDPHDQQAVLLGHDTPFEMAVEALGRQA